MKLTRIQIVKCNDATMRVDSLTLNQTIGVLYFGGKGGPDEWIFDPALNRPFTAPTLREILCVQEELQRQTVAQREREQHAAEARNLEDDDEDADLYDY